MDIGTFALFEEVYRAGGFAAAAKARGVAPSSVSRAIAGLEADLSVRLFHRTTRRLSPTEAGDAFYQRISPLLEEFNKACAEARDFSDRPSGHLRVAASVSFGELMITPHIGAFRDAYPDIILELVLSDARIDLVEERIDIAIRHGALEDSSLIARKLRDVSYRLVASPQLMSQIPPLKAPEDICQYPTVTFSYDAFRTSWRFRKKRTEIDVPITPVMTVSNAVALLSCVRQGVGLALLADWMITDDLNQGRLVDVLPGWEAGGDSFQSAVSLVFPSRAYMPAKVKAFEAFLRPRLQSGNA